jgi:hypothetical protein
MSVNQMHECPQCHHTWLKDPDDKSYGDYQGACAKCGYPNLPITADEWYRSFGIGLSTEEKEERKKK